MKKSFFKGLTPPPSDPVLGLYYDFLADQRPEKVSLLVGMDSNAKGETLALAAVKAAEAIVIGRERSHAYHNVAGFLPYLSAIQGSMFSEEVHPYIASVQTPGGTGSLSTILAFCKTIAGCNPQLYVADHTWDIHPKIGVELGYNVSKYPYLNVTTKGVDFERMFTFLESLKGTENAIPIVLLQGCCQNPTGADLSLYEWERLGKLAIKNNMFLVVDLAYQGYDKGVWEDAACVRVLQSLGLEFGVVTSCSKNLSMYNRRIGAAHIVCRNVESVVAIQGRMAEILRWNVSTVNLFAAQVVAQIYQNSELKKLWLDELAANRKRIKLMRQAFVEGMKDRGFTEFEYVLKQNGLFSFTGFSKEIAQRLKVEHAVYILDNGSGRICLPGLNDENLDNVLDAIAAVLR